MKPLLVDLDLDFFFNNPADWTQSPDKALWPGGESLIDYLSSLNAKERVLVIDHHEVLHHWDIRCYKKAFCLHIDAHHDAFAKDANAWRRALGSRGSMVGVGDFIFQALREEIIEQLVWLTPPTTVPSDSAESLHTILGPRLGCRVDVLSWPRLPQIPYNVDMLSVSISPEWLNPNNSDWIKSTLLRLGFEATDIDQGLTCARKRWMLAQEHTEYMMPFRYRFPEDYR